MTRIVCEAYNACHYMTRIVGGAYNLGQFYWTIWCRGSSVVEHVLGKNGVVGSSPILGSTFRPWASGGKPVLKARGVLRSFREGVQAYLCAEVAEWSNAPVCKTGAFMASGVRIPPSAPPWHQAKLPPWCPDGSLLDVRAYWSMYYVYVLKSSRDKKFYTGATNNLKRRLTEHNTGKNISTKARIPLKLIYYEAYLMKEDAEAREKFLKTNLGKRFLKKQLKNYLEKQAPR